MAAFALAVAYVFVKNFKGQLFLENSKIFLYVRSMQDEAKKKLISGLC